MKEEVITVLIEEIARLTASIEKQQQIHNPVSNDIKAAVNRRIAELKESIKWLSNI